MSKATARSTAWREAEVTVLLAIPRTRTVTKNVQALDRSQKALPNRITWEGNIEEQGWDTIEGPGERAGGTQSQSLAHLADSIKHTQGEVMCTIAVTKES